MHMSLFVFYVEINNFLCSHSPYYDLLSSPPVRFCLYKEGGRYAKLLLKFILCKGMKSHKSTHCLLGYLSSKIVMLIKYEYISIFIFSSVIAVSMPLLFQKCRCILICIRVHIYTS